MAAAIRNGPLALVTHRRPLTPCRCIGLIGDNPRSKRIYFSLAMRGSLTLKMLQWQGKIHRHHCLITVHFEGHRPSNCWRKAYLLTWGSSPIDPTCMHSKLDLMCSGRRPFLAAAAMVVTVVGFLWQSCLSVKS